MKLIFKAKRNDCHDRWDYSLDTGVVCFIHRLKDSWYDNTTVKQWDDDINEWADVVI